MTKTEALQVNTTMLAYLGDAVYELEIRRHVMELCQHDAGKAHKLAVRYVSADAQAMIAKQLIADGFLTEEEERLLKRARNHRTMSKPANADPKNYKVATGFEALIGFLHITEQVERLTDLIAEAIQIVESKYGGCYM